MVADVDSTDDPFALLLSRPTRGCCNDQQLDALILGEASTDEATALRAHLDRSPTCRARHDELRASHEAWRQSAPPLTMSTSSPTATVTSLSDRRRWSSRAVAAGVLAAAAAVIVLVARAPTVDDGSDVIRTKGAPLKAAFAVAGGADLYDGDTVALPATLTISLRGREQGVVIVEARDTGAGWRALTAPAAWTSTTQATVPATTAARVDVRVVACDDVDAFVGDRVGCDVDGIGVVVEAR